MPALHFMLQLKHYVQNYTSILYLTVVISESCQSQLICCVKIIIIRIPCHSHKRQFWYLSEMFFFSIIFFFDTFLLYKLSVLVNHSPQGSCKLMLNTGKSELACQLWLKLCTFSVKLTSVNLVPVSTPSATNPP